LPALGPRVDHDRYNPTTLIGQTLSHFRITAKLGEGGMGEVWQAEDTKLGREVAIKIPPEAFVADPERLARFEREARMLATLDHANIAGIFEVGEYGPLLRVRARRRPGPIAVPRPSAHLLRPRAGLGGAVGDELVRSAHPAPGLPLRPWLPTSRRLPRTTSWEAPQPLRSPRRRYP
jgi:hypothetical protein